MQEGCYKQYLSKGWYIVLIALNKFLDNFPGREKKRDVLNGQYSSCVSCKTRVPQGLILGPLFFLALINGLSDNLFRNPKLFVDDASLLMVVQYIALSANNLNDDLKEINN